MEQLDLSEFLKTPAQAEDFSARLSSIIEEMYKTDFNFEMSLLEQFGIQKRDKFIGFVRENKIDVESKSALLEFLKKIQERITSLPVLSLTLAFEPKEQTLMELSQWFVLNTNKQVLFDIKVDPDLIAGSAITLNGKYLDFSIRSQFDQILNDALKTIPGPTTHKQNLFTPMNTPQNTQQTNPIPTNSTIENPAPHQFEQQNMSASIAPPQEKPVAFQLEVQSAEPQSPAPNTAPLVSPPAQNPVSPPGGQQNTNNPQPNSAQQSNDGGLK